MIKILHYCIRNVTQKNYCEIVHFSQNTFILKFCIDFRILYHYNYNVTKRHAERHKTAERGKMANSLKTLRESLGRTQQEFADELGVTRATISNYEIGRREPDGAFFKKLKEKYNVTDKAIGGMLLEYAEQKKASTTN